MRVNIPETDKERIVIVGGGFGGLTMARKLAKSGYQVILVDKRNYHQFQPLFYQVAMAGLEPSAISFPFRKAFQKHDNIYFRIGEVKNVVPDEKRINTNIGHINYDYLILAYGAKTNFFGNKAFEEKAFTIKSTGQALNLRNTMLTDYEQAVVESDFERRQWYLDIVIVGGGPTGVEVAGALAEMKKYILPKDYKEINAKEIDIYLLQGSDQLLQGMDPKLGKAAEKYLKQRGVVVKKNTRVVDYDGTYVFTAEGDKIKAGKLIWAAGVTCSRMEGLNYEAFNKSNRLIVDEFNRVVGYNDIYSIGDLAYMETAKFPLGHPQVAQPAIQQGRNLAKNFKLQSKGKDWKPFRYRDLGTMATIGRNKAVAEIAGFKFTGFFAWMVWLLVHLYALIGVRNKILVFFNWIWNYVTYDQSLRLIINTKNHVKREKPE